MGRRGIVAMATALVVVGAGAFTLGRASVTTGSKSNTTTTTRSSAFSNFRPLSASFASSQVGWALGTASCANARECLVLQATVDGGHAWTPEVLPTSLVKAASARIGHEIAALYAQTTGTGLHVYFSNLQDGWIYGTLSFLTQPGNEYATSSRVVLFSTHDAGGYWSQVSIPWIAPQGSIFDLEASGDNAYLLGWARGYRVALTTSPVGTDNWQMVSAPALGDQPAGGTQVVGQLHFLNSRGWLSVGNDRGVVGSDRMNVAGKWSMWGIPCRSNDNGYAQLAVASTSDVIAACTIGGYGGYVSPGGPPGAVLNTTWLYSSHDGGATFQAVSQIGRARFFGVNALVYLEPGIVLAATQNGAGGSLLASYDAGRHWTQVYRGDVVALSFMSSSRGFAVVQGPRGNYLMMTLDTGHHWARVTF